MTKVTGSNVYFWSTFDQLTSAVLGNHSDTQFTISDGWNSVTVTGTGFTYANGAPSGGTITSITVTPSDSSHGSGTFTEISVPVATFWTAVRTGNWTNLYTLIFAGNDTFTGTSRNDTFDISQGGDDVVYTMGNDDVVLAGGALTPNDRIVGAGINPENGSVNAVNVVLDGDYSAGLTLSATTLVNVTGLRLTAGHSYKITTNDAMMTHIYQSYPDLNVDGLSLGATDTLYYDGSAETDAVQGIRGGAGNDTLIGGAADDYINGGGGNDDVYGGGGGDTLDGGSGVNAIHGGADSDMIYAYLGEAGSQIFGDAGNDYVLAGTSNGSAYEGGVGKDYWRYWGDQSFARRNLTINLSTGLVTDGTNTDTITGFEGASGGWGDDTVLGTSGNDWLVGGNGNDLLEGGAGDDTLIGQSDEGVPFGNGHVFWGGPWGDLPEIDAASWANAPSGEIVDAGADLRSCNFLAGVASGGDGLDQIWVCEKFILSSYNDVFMGSPLCNNDYFVYGGDGNDTITVNKGLTFGVNLGVNALDGGNGDDTITGGIGSDWIIGGAGADMMTGGPGRDTFAFGAASDLSLSTDHVTDFAPNEDKFDFSAIVGLRFIGTSAFSGVAGQLRYTFVDGQTVISYDTNGDGHADGTVILDNGQFQFFEKTAGSGVLQADLNGPNVVGHSLTTGLSDGRLIASYILTFSENIVAGTGNIELHKADGTLLSKVSCAWVTISGDCANIRFPVNPDLGSSYYLTLEPDTFTDALGNSFAGVTSADALTFVMPATYPDPGPVLQSSSVDCIATGPSFISSITMTFDKPVHPVSGTIMLSHDFPFGAFISISATDSSQVTVSGNTLTIRPTTPLFGSTNYRFTTAEFFVADDVGNQAMVYDGSVSFTTQARQDTTLPALVSAQVGDGSGTVSPDSDITITFSEPVNTGLVTYMFSYEDYFHIVRSDGTLIKSIASNDKTQVTFSGNTVTINPNVDLPANATFSVYYGAYAVQDLAGNYDGAFDVGEVPITGLNLATTFTTYSKITGTDSADVMPGTAAGDTMSGLGGNDVFTGGAGNDKLDGGDGFDKAVFSGNSSAYTVTCNPDGSTTVVGADGTDTLRNVEELDFLDTHIALGLSVTGTAGNDAYTGTAYNDVFDLTQGGDDTASGLGGADTFKMGRAFNAADRLDGGAGADTVQMDGDYAGGLTLNATTMVNVESLVLAAGHSYSITSANATVAAGQTLTVNASALGAGNALNFNGAAETDGSFVFTGGAGNDVLRGGSGSDTADYSGATSGVTINLTAATAQAIGGGMGSDTLIGIENLTGSAFADTLVGDGGNNILTGGAGADTLRPGMGSDTIYAGDGNDTISFTGGRFDAADMIDGGAGNDLLWLTGDYTGGVVMNAATLTNVESIAVAAGFNYSLTTADTTVGAGQQLSVDTTSMGASNSLYFDGSAETNGSFTLLTGAGADTLIGGGSGDTFRAGGGFDHVSGNGGNDSISFSLGHLDAADVIDGGAGTDLVWLNTDYTGANAVTFNATTLANVETIALSVSYSFSLTTADATVGAGRQLTVDGSGLGAAKTLSFNGSAETDGSFLVIGGAGADTIIGGSGNDTLSGRAGNDTLRAGFGNDVAFGGDGDDTISFTNGKLNASDIVDGGAGWDTVWLNGDYTGANAVNFFASTMANVESIGFAAGFNYTLKSSDGTVASGKMLTLDASTLGASNALSFDGSAETNGAFTFVSGTGGDVFTGGSGADTFKYDAASRSTGLHYDTIHALNFANDSFDIPGGVGVVTGIDAAKTTGALSTASFDTDLATALSALGAHHAILFTPNAGSMSGQTFMVVDCNGTAGYQSGQDLVIRLNGYSGALAAGAFH